MECSGGALNLWLQGCRFDPHQMHWLWPCASHLIHIAPPKLNKPQSFHHNVSQRWGKPSPTMYNSTGQCGKISQNFPKIFLLTSTMPTSWLNHQSTKTGQLSAKNCQGWPTNFIHLGSTELFFSVQNFSKWCKTVACFSYFGIWM